jgi:hypothetical protein
MARREINLDEETDRILEEFAREYEGGPDEALADLLHAHESIETFVEQCEEAHRETPLAQLEGGARGFREGRSTSWDEVKRRNSIAVIIPAANRQA